MELSKLKTREMHEKGVDVQIKCPSTGELLDFYITIIGPDSKAWRRIQKAEIRDYLAPGREEDSEDELLQKHVDKIVAITIGWKGLTDEGKEVEFTKEKCAELYNDAPYIMDQVDLAAGQFRNFIKG